MFAAKTARIACALFAVAAFAGGAHAATYTFDTSDSPFTAGIENVGNWSPTATNSNTNTNYALGYSGETAWRNFFTFNLASLGPNQQIVSATLELRKWWYTSSDPSETVQLFDVSTSAAVLNNNVGPSTSIFDDLGSGANYGSVAIGAPPVPASPDTGAIISVALNGAALADIAAASRRLLLDRRQLPDLHSLPHRGRQNVFSTSSATGIQRLIIEAIPAVPEPSTYAMLGIGLVALAFLRRRKAG